MGATSEHFSNSELACHHCGVNECSPELVEALEKFRTLSGQPVIVNDAYRCAVHNAATANAAKASEHLMGRAADIRISGMTAAQLEAIANKIPEIKGIGRADNQGYLHIDVREQPARWCYDYAGKSCSYYPPLKSA
jgi:uncharacterized protein YcbK (DUF882 family)